MCNPARALEPGDPRYVSSEGVRGQGDLITRMTSASRRSEEPVHLLFSGHRGAGKSTELRRLVDRLVHPGGDARPFFVVYFEAEQEDVDINDIDLPDVLLAVVRHLGIAFRKELHEELRSPWLNRFMDDIRELLGSEVNFEKLEWDAKIAKFTATIKGSPSARKTIRAALEPNISNLLQSANDLITEAVTRLEAKGYRDLVLIIDDLGSINFWLMLPLERRGDIVDILQTGIEREWAFQDIITAYYANMLAIGRGAEARNWLQRHLPHSYWKWLKQNDRELRQIIATAASRCTSTRSKGVIEQNMVPHVVREE